MGGADAGEGVQSNHDFNGAVAGEAGFAAVDALAALAILAVTISLSISALVTARGLGERSLEATQARTLLSTLLSGGAQPPGAYGGRQARFSWALDVTAEGDQAGVRICRRRVEARSLTSERSYVYETRAVCPLETERGR